MSLGNRSRSRSKPAVSQGEAAPGTGGEEGQQLEKGQAAAPWEGAGSSLGEEGQHHKALKLKTIKQEELLGTEK